MNTPIKKWLLKMENRCRKLIVTCENLENLGTKVDLSKLPVNKRNQMFKIIHAKETRQISDILSKNVISERRSPVLLVKKN